MQTETAGRAIEFFYTIVGAGRNERPHEELTFFEEEVFERLLEALEHSGEWSTSPICNECVAGTGVKPCVQMVLLGLLLKRWSWAHQLPTEQRVAILADLYSTKQALEIWFQKPIPVVLLVHSTRMHHTTNPSSSAQQLEEWVAEFATSPMTAT